MPVYQFSPEGNNAMKTTWTRTMWVYYGVIIAVFGYNLLYKSNNTLSTGLFVAIIAALAFAYAFGRKKYFAIIDSTKLVADDNGVTLRVKGRPDITIAYNNIKNITHRKDGIQLTSNLPAGQSMIIINKFENFYEIEKLVTDKAHANELAPDSQQATIR